MDEIKINIKPLSVNDCWRGRRFKTPEYRMYWMAVSLMLPKKIIVPAGLFKVYYEFGLSSNGGDWDNGVKPLQDILSAKYKFNDNRIMEANVKKVIVPKGSEYISFKIEGLGIKNLADEVELLKRQMNEIYELAKFHKDIEGIIELIEKYEK